MRSLLRNWKTSLIGSGAIVTAVTMWQMNPTDLKTPIVTLVLGVLGLVAKDGNVTGK